MRELGDLARAKEYYYKAIEIDGEYGPAYNNLGVVYREEGNFTESVKYLKKANKYHSYYVNFDDERAFYKEPGCIVPLVIIFLLIVFLVIIS